MTEKKGILSSIFSRSRSEEDNTDEKQESVEPRTEEKEERSAEEIFELSAPAIENAKLTLLDILKTMRMDVEVVVAKSEKNSIDFEITGEADLGLVIGKDGNTLASLQLILSTILSKKYQTRIYINIDANKYKAKKDAAIISSALDAADVVEKEGVQIVLDPMNARERRLVHMTLQERDGIETLSRGEKALRQVVVSPKNYKEKK